MAIKVFLDANVLLDYILKREYYIDAKEIFSLLEDKHIEGYITSSVLHITGHWVSKAYGAENAKKILLNLLQYVSIIDILHDTALIALHSKINDIEDALQYYTAIHHKLNYFISRDRQLQKDSIPALQVHPPADFITRIR